MITIKILGSGCTNCKQLEHLVMKVTSEMKVEAEILKITDPLQYSDYEVITTPGLVINEKTVSSGNIPSIDELTGFLNSALATSS